MITVVVAGRKGGPGKSTTTLNFVSSALKHNKTVAMADVDPQGTLAIWWNDRYEAYGHETTPYFINVDFNNLQSYVEQARDTGLDYLIIDTPPAMGEELGNVVAVADIVLIACHPSKADLDAVENTLTHTQKHNVPYAFVVNRAKKNTTQLSDTLVGLSQSGPIAATIHDRIAFAEMLNDGRTIHEYAGTGENSPAHEADVLFKYVQSTMKKLHKSKPREVA